MSDYNINYKACQMYVCNFEPIGCRLTLFQPLGATFNVSMLVVEPADIHTMDII